MILLFGGNGQLGRELTALCQARGIALRAFGRTEADIADPDAVASRFATTNPSLVVNAAAYTAVDNAESNIEEAERANEIGPAVLAKLCAGANVPLIHFSTDYVFDGRKSGGYVEDDPVAPLGVYGRTKLGGEEAVRAHHREHLILRTSWVYGPYGRNLLKTALELAQQRDELRFVADQRGCPTCTADIAEAILYLSPRLAARERVWGTYHFAGTGVTTWFGFVQKVVELQSKFTGRRPEVRPITTADYPTPARRPANSELELEPLRGHIWLQGAGLDSAGREHGPTAAAGACGAGCMNRKGVILAGGSGTRSHPLTLVTSKQLLPVFDKPMIYYPLTTLMLAGIREVLLITTPQDQRAFQRLLGNGKQWGMQLEYAVQPSPDGLAQAFVIAEDFLRGYPSCLVLGDNLLYGHGLSETLGEATDCKQGATIFGYHVEHPERYGVVTLDQNGRPTSIEEKPQASKSHWAVIGLYFYDETVIDRVREVRPSGRGEYEITDLNRLYLDDGTLDVRLLGRGYAWFDAGTHEFLLEAAEFVRVLQTRQGQLIASPEEVAYTSGWIGRDDLAAAGRRINNQYGRALAQLSRDHDPRGEQPSKQELKSGAL